MRIFLSYASEDKAIAEPIAFSLRARGHAVFLDRDDLPAGGEYDRRIERAVDQTGLFVFLVSPASVARGRFTLTELEFARRKWGKPDGHVLPVMIAPTAITEVPGFLKSVTILEPKGNAAAEVASAVDAMAASTVRTGTLVFAAAGLVSGALTTPLLMTLSDTKLLDGIDIGRVPADIVAAGILFAVTLAFALFWQFRFRLRHLLIILAVMAGWHLALEVFVRQGASPPKGVVEEEAPSELEIQCQLLAEGSLATPDSALEKSCIELKLGKAESELSSTRSYWNSLVTHGASGAIGALLTVLGIPLATGRRFPVAGMIAATLTGTAAAMLFFAGVSAFTAIQSWGFYTLFIPWQTAVAGVIGRYLR